ncbi:DUF1839 family protein [Neorhizobium alkalisoli]|uniref:Succinylarginine dihydrolase n=1 Tax=Neorhizobium alkalisoli TaxID=528178 RepID=A0A561PZ70_9HYPH|nr:DUF1839 family protein [Neorhizobium alkalisoli]TWF43416.1 succinylarginine dihydrolase [Neorhizobium alkalisoli]
MTKVFDRLDPTHYRPHALHSADRIWPETNCYADLWIEVLSAAGMQPEAMLAFTLTQDFEGDQFTFFKVPLEDLEALYGIRVTELAIFDAPQRHVLEQIGRGRLTLLELDSYYLPDTRGLTYHQEHGKTTVAINRLDLERRELDYFHNGGFFTLSGNDLVGLLQLNGGPDAPLFLPYTEFAKFPASYPSQRSIREMAWKLLRHHYARRPEANPVRAFASVFPEQAHRLAERDFAFFHKYAFNTLRQLGANFELLASHLAWLNHGAFEVPEKKALKISETAKSTQFLLARALARKKFEPLAAALEPAADAWDGLMSDLGRTLDQSREAA